MTREEILNMPAGREMDKLIAEKVMGWKWDTYFLNGVETSGLFGPEGLRCVNDYPEYSTDIRAAWEVVEKMQSNGYCFDADGNARRRRIRFGIGQEIGEAETMPLAVCRAALLAVMEEK